MSNCALPPLPQFVPQFGIKVGQEIDNGTNRNDDTTFLFDFYAHRAPILHRFATMQICRRRTDKGQATLHVTQTGASKISSPVVTCAMKTSQEKPTKCGTKAADLLINY